LTQSYDEVLETVLIELLVLTASAPMGTIVAFNQLCDGIARELNPETLDRCVDYANYRIDQLKSQHNP